MARGHRKKASGIRIAGLGLALAGAGMAVAGAAQAATERVPTSPGDIVAGLLPSDSASSPISGQVEETQSASAGTSAPADASGSA
ncbi:hypothetical protein, partial [Streptacidiphilus monticola]